jgi:hypothetical protein
LAVNQDVQAATGCSIDSSVEFIQSLEQKYSVDLLDKMNVTFKLGEHIAHKPLIDFKKMVKDKAVTENTIVFNQLIIFKNIMSLGKFQQLTAGTVVFKIRLRFLKKRHQNIS